MKLNRFKIRSCFCTVLFAVFVFISESKAQIITTFAGNGIMGYSGDGGIATAAQINGSGNITFDAAGNTIIMDNGNGSVRKVNSSGIITTIAGNGTNGYSGDGGPATAAQMVGPLGGTYDGLGNLLIPDGLGHSVRKISTSGIITTIASDGTGTSGYSGDGGQATNAKFYNPRSIVIDDTGNIYICDGGNRRIRKVNATGIITNFAGNGTVVYSGGGVPATAEGMSPSFMFMRNNVLYFSANNRICKIDLSGIVTTVAGTGTAGFSGDGGQATSAALKNPLGVCFDSLGNMYVSDAGNNRIRMISPSGIITTIVGTGVSGYFGDGGPAISAQIIPGGIAIHDGDLYICDAGNNRIRVVKGIVSVKDIADATRVRLYPNPTTDALTLETPEEGTYSIHSITGQMMAAGELKKGTQSISLQGFSPGTYVISLSKDGVVYGARCFVKN